MLWLILSGLAYAAAAGAAIGAVGYVAATRFSLVQRLLATLVDRTLEKIADTGQAAYSVTHTDTGAALPGGGRLAPKPAAALAAAPFYATA